MPNRWKVVIGTLILFVWAAAYTLWDLLDKSTGMNTPLRETQWAPEDMKKVWIPGVATALTFIVAIIGDILNKPPPPKSRSSK
jgi:hypothetical protein